jgi:LacI family transcriptional regulator
MNSITLKDIAKVFGCSVSTVSKSLKNSHQISPETKDKIVTYAKAHNYRPNRMAVSLKHGQTNIIGVVVASINNTFISQLLDGIQKASLNTGYDIIIMQSFENAEQEKSCLTTLMARGVQGILMAPVDETSNAAYLEYIKANYCPIVLFDRINSGLDTTKVGANDYEGAFMATQHLIEIKRKRILFVTTDKFGESHPRMQGFKKALKNFDVPFNPNYVVKCDIENIDTLDAKITQTLLSLKQQNIMPNALFGATDIITIRSLGILASLKIKVPEEVAVIGFSNTDIAFSLNPPLSTIRQPATEIGFLALTKLVEILESTDDTKPRPETVRLETTLQLRDSTRLSLAIH